MKELKMFINYLDNQGKSKKTQEDYEVVLNKWIEYQNIQTLEDLNNIKPYDIELYDTSLKERDLSVNTRFSYTVPIKMFYKYLIDMELLDKNKNNPYKLNYKIVNKNIAKPLTKEQTKQFLNSCIKKRDKALLNLMVEIFL